MKIRFYLILMTLTAVVSDTMLHPFYPHFFSDRFDIQTPEHTGYYLAACCLTVMVAFPFWAYVNKKVHLFKILIYTQVIAGMLCISCYWIEDIELFWVVALSMIAFKGSYLLVYPFIMKIEEQENHASAISILSVVLHLGAILGAFIGGMMVDWFDTKLVFFVMAVGDFIQMGMCLYLRSIYDFDKELTVMAGQTQESRPSSSLFKIPTPILKVSIITLVLYFSTFMIRPFFSLYWEQVSEYDSKSTTGLVYAIPAFVGLAALWYNTKHKEQTNPFLGILPALGLGISGILLQGIPNDTAVLVGRIVYGWAVFQVYVKFDVIAFQLSSPADYAMDYSKIHFFQNIGVLSASIVAGWLVDWYDLQMPFWVAAAGFVMTLLIYYVSFRHEFERKLDIELVK
ncbi:MFS transporter [Limibacter armeniacum]|uniref:MFS transporter n=1 Tax=Limibacter armeniacum TaxID=466084 RepID=UPI002FE5C881